MADEYVVKDPDGTTRTTVIERRGGSGVLLVGLAILLVLAVVAGMFLFEADRNDATRTQAVTTTSERIDQAADKAGAAADRAAEKADRAIDQAAD